ncbi:MAG TPA: DUF4382 domain-containing protein [Chryseosolibacter sp.]|nr:DUF4382 domain-containing protein [Chryseosolibacter sp.]
MKKLFLFAVALISVFLMSCQDDDPKNAKIEVWLTDDWGDYQEVNVDIQSVQVHATQTDSENGWQTVEVTPKVYNLLEFANGQETLLGGLELPAGKISQIRLKLGENNTVKVGDVVYDLETPSAQQSGLKLQVHEILAEGITYKIVLDFEAGKSVIHTTGTGTYVLRPVIRAITEAQDGAIKGIVDPAGVVAVSLMAADTVHSTTSTNEQGEFFFQGLQPGTYKLVFDTPGEDPLVEKTGVEVQLGVVTDVGTIDVAP